MSKSTERYTSSDGLLSSADPGAVALWESIGARMSQEKAGWTATLRAMGVKLAHPDDGWVNRERGSFSWSWYPQFDDRPEVGDLVAFGRPTDVAHYRERGMVGEPESASQGYRLCRVTGVERRHSILGYMQSLTYEDTGVRLPPRGSGPVVSWVRRLFARSA